MELTINGRYRKLWSKKSPRMFYAIFFIVSVTIIFSLDSFFLTSFFTHSSTKFKQVNLQNNHTNISSVFPVDPLLINLTFSVNTVYHHNGIAYDYYSKTDLGQSKASYQWNIWPLPNEINQNSSINLMELSPFVLSKLPFVDSIYVITNSRFIERHSNMKKVLHHQGISNESLKWKMKWDRTKCNSNLSHSYVYQRLNLQDRPLDEQQQRNCPITMEHVDVWYEMAEQQVQLGLILEDDAIFVPFFKEKFTRMIYAAIRSGILRMNKTCVTHKDKSILNNGSIHRNPMIVIGTATNVYSKSFEKDFSNASPLLSTNNRTPSRCTHAYLLTSCTAQALVDQIQLQKNQLFNSDVIQDYLFGLSHDLQSFWMDPPLAHQGNHVIDLDKLSSFKITTYK